MTNETNSPASPDSRGDKGVQAVIDENNAAFASATFRHTKMVPGDDLHLTFLMAPFSLNLVVGEDRVALLNFGRAVWAAARKDAGVSNE